jgi:serine/threonine protein kinase
MLKLLEKDSDELEVLKHLNLIKSDTNHVIELLDTFHLPDIGTIIALPIASPLDCSEFTSPPVACYLMHQLVEAVAFIHANGVAHLDLKPPNLLVSCIALPRLIMIDFSVSVIAKSANDQIEGYVGTPPWVAPEVGCEDGPPQTYSPIRADLWACGRLLLHIANRTSAPDATLQQLAKELLNPDPLQRPLLLEVPKARAIEPEQKRLMREHEDAPTPKRICVETSKPSHSTQGNFSVLARPSINTIAVL